MTDLSDDLFHSKKTLCCGSDCARFVAVVTGRSDPGNKFHPKYPILSPTFRRKMVKRLELLGIESETIKLPASDAALWLTENATSYPILFVRASPNVPFFMHWVVLCGKTVEGKYNIYDSRLGPANTSKQKGALGNKVMDEHELLAVWQGFCVARYAVVPNL